MLHPCHFYHYSRILRQIDVLVEHQISLLAGVEGHSLAGGEKTVGFTCEYHASPMPCD